MHIRIYVIQILFLFSHKNWVIFSPSLLLSVSLPILPPSLFLPSLPASLLSFLLLPSFSFLTSFEINSF